MTSSLIHQLLDLHLFDLELFKFDHFLKLLDYNIFYFVALQAVFKLLLKAGDETQ